MSLNFGGSADKPATGFSLGAPQTSAAAPVTGFNFTGGDASQTATSAAPGFQVKPTFSLVGSTQGAGATPSFSLPSTSTTSTGLTLGGAATGSTGFNLAATPGTAATTSAATGFAATSLPSTAPQTFSSGFGLGAPATTTPASTGFSLSGTTTAAATGFSLTPTTTTAAASTLTGGLLLGSATTSTSTTGTTSFSLPLNFGQAASTTTTVTSTSSSAAPGVGGTGGAGVGGTGTNLNFGQLEETINKWTMDLEEQEKLFMNQATQVNAWDHLLTTNGEKIVQLNEAVEAVKVEQQQLDHELDFILAQQRELEDCLVPLEKELASTAVLDPERRHTYELAETMDTQLKQMSEDLREIIEYLNENNRSQDSSDPLVQIGRILNAHMNSLQWIDQNTAVIQNHLDQVVKLHESHRRDNERSFHVPYS